ncbi:UvrD-helicase domain-containing protein [Corynebacterium choanae]|uniref:DNA 3'-5' helicase n=1 Tax=Corynebacterium choanae TaxID=1862358 RepID=A0A3G6J7R6_9CORY|nr:UvrD-helicase domain-containing protein [Corynebacterium choanae]AZA12938.1 DNA-dependent helicase II [Corynebacterium choanae]
MAIRNSQQEAGRGTGSVVVRLHPSTRAQAEQDAANDAAQPAASGYVWPKPVQALLAGDTGRIQLNGVAGSGKTTLLEQIVIARLQQGVPASSITVIAGSKQQAAAMKQRLHAAVPDHYVGGDHLVRSVHSLAFAIVRAAAAKAGRPLPRLMTGAEHDDALRQLLQGQLAEGGQLWPENLRPALAVTSFARGLRDLLLRAAERGMSAPQLAELGRVHHRPLWEAAAATWEEFHGVLTLADKHLMSAAELTSSAVAALRADADLLTDVAAQAEILLVDDVHNIDPASATLLRLLAAHAHTVVFAGDPQQAVFRFRGGSAELLRSDPAFTTVQLGEPQRQPAHTQTVIVPDAMTHASVIAHELRTAHYEQGVPFSEMAVIVRSTAETAALRRRLAALEIPLQQDATDITIAHQPLTAALLLVMESLTKPLTFHAIETLALGPLARGDAVSWRRLQRALVAPAHLHHCSPRQLLLTLVAGDTVASDHSTGGTPPAEAATRGPDLFSAAAPQSATGTSELPLALSAASIDAIIESFTSSEQLIVQRLRRIMQAGHNAYQRGESVEAILWEIWAAADVANSLAEHALRGGSRGARAHQDLDAVMTLFDMAGDFSEHRTGAGLQSFVEWISGQDLPIAGRVRQSAVDAVHLVNAHATVGRQWDTVIVAQVQEGTWPSYGITGTLFAQEELVDLLDFGVPPAQYIARSAERIKEERRLFHLACTRATRSLIVTAIDAPESDPVYEVSRFIDEADARRITQQDLPGLRTVSPPTLVAELRRTLCDETAPDTLRQAAACQLHRLHKAGVAGSDPTTWWGQASIDDPTHAAAVVQGQLALAHATGMPLNQLPTGLVQQATTSMPPAAPDYLTTRLSPSLVETAVTNPLAARLRGIEDDDADLYHLRKGNFVHAVAEIAAVQPLTDDDIVTLSELFTTSVNPPAWRIAAERADIQGQLYALRRALASLDAVTAAAAPEVHCNVTLHPHTVASQLAALAPPEDLAQAANSPAVVAPQATAITITGRIDRLIRTDADEYIIIDFKTGQAVTYEQASRHLQLATYQLALVNGQVQATDLAGTAQPQWAITSAKRVQPQQIDVAKLVFLTAGKDNPVAREQARLDPAQLGAINDTVTVIAYEQAANYALCTDAGNAGHFEQVFTDLAQQRSTTHVQ